MKKSLPTVSIGIPAYNEEANIAKLLNALLLQDMSQYKLEKIVVISDRCDDGTVDEVKAILDKRVRLVVGKVRKGQAIRQNEIVCMCKADLLVLLNADVLPVNKDCIANLITPMIKDKQIGLTSGLLIPLPSPTLMGKVKRWSIVWKQKLFEQLNNQDTVYLCHGTIRAFSKGAYSQIRWPNTASEDAYSYFAAREAGLKFRFVKKAAVFFQAPQTVADQLNQSQRFYTSSRGLARFIDENVLDEAYKIPVHLVLKIGILAAFTQPAYALIYGMVLSWCKITSMRMKNLPPNLWSHVSSTKKLVGVSSHG